MVNIIGRTVRTPWREPGAVCVFCLGDLLREHDGTWRAAGTERDAARRCPSEDAGGHVHAGASCKRCGKALVPDPQASTDVWFARYPAPGTASQACGDDGQAHEPAVTLRSWARV